jgi:predicted CopG family antitoxin
MATKTLSITEEAYDILRSIKGENESFTNAIIRLADKKSILELAGLISEEEAKSIKSAIKKRREESRGRINKIMESL